MHITQTTLTDTDTKTEIDYLEPSEETDDPEHLAIREDPTLAPPDQRGGTRCCPWCLAAPDIFEYHDDETVKCGHCDAAIPVGADWFERGEKIVI